jgi:tight adherence protein B
MRLAGNADDSDIAAEISLMTATVATGRSFRDALLMHNPIGLGPVTQAARDGLPLSSQLVTVAMKRSIPELEALASAIEVCEQTGASLLPALDVVALQLRQREARGRQVRNELAGTRATVMVLAALPLLGIAMSSVAGGDSVAWLAHTTSGHMCLVIGMIFEACGLMWVRALVQRVSR